MLKEQTLETIDKFADEGGVVVWTGALPEATAEEGYTPGLTEKIKKSIASGSNRVHFSAGENYDPVFEFLDKKVPLSYKWKDDSILRIQHKRDEDRNIFLLVNPTATEITGELQLDYNGTIYIFDTETGEGSKLKTNAVEGKNVASLHFSGYSAQFIVVD